MARDYSEWSVTDVQQNFRICPLHLDEDPGIITLENRILHVDDRGSLFEILRSDDEEFRGLEQVYRVHNPVRETIRGFHAHNRLVDYFCVLEGSALFVVWEISPNVDPPHSVKYAKVCLTARKPQVMTVLPGQYHGWKSLEDNTILLSNASELYDYDCPDEIRVPWDILGEDIWNVEFK